MTQGRSDTSVDTNGIPEPSGWEDPLTGLNGPDFWRRLLVAEVARSHRYKRSMTVVVVELAGLEQIEATWGVDVARHTLREASQAVLRTSRSSEVLRGRLCEVEDGSRRRRRLRVARLAAASRPHGERPTTKVAFICR